MNGFKARTKNQKFRYFNNKKLKNSNFGENKYKKHNTYNDVDEISEYLINISYILNEKYDKYFVYELREENLKKGYKLFNSINLEYSYDLEDDICILVKIMDEIKNNESELINQRKCSKIMEKLIFYCFLLLKYNEKNVKNKDISIQCLEIYNHFFKVILSNFINLSKSDYASHFLQTVICVFAFFNKYEEKYMEDINKKHCNYKKISNFFIEVCNIIVENIFSLIFDKCGTHVLRSFLYSLGGYLNINISNITFRKSKARKITSKNELKYTEKNYENSFFYDYIYKIIEKITEEIINPNSSLTYKNLLYQYIFYDNEKEGEENHEKYIMESSNQYFICPLLYNTYSVPALGILFEILKDKNVECDKLICEILLIEKTKKYYIDKTRMNVKYHGESPLKQLLDILIKLDNSSIMIEKLLKINNEHIFYVYNVYIVKNINNLICDNAYSNIVIYNYLNFEYITEEMFDLLIKNIDIEKIIKNKKYNILKCLFDLSQCYKTNCKFLFNSLIKNLNLDNNNNNSNKFMWISILCMCNFNDLHTLILDTFNKKESKTVNGDIIKESNSDNNQNDLNYNSSNTSSNLNNYNFYNYIKIDINGYYILSHILSFPKESIIPLINSFKHFCNFLRAVSQNKPNETDINNYNKFCETFIYKGEYNTNNNIENIKNIKYTDETNITNENFNNNSNENNYNSVNNNFINQDNSNNKKKIKPFVRKNAELRGNILLYFSCDKNLSILCEKIAHTFNIINEKYLRTFILLFKNEYKNIASNYIGAHSIVTFFKLGSNDIKKRILDELIENDINIYNNYIKSFMKLKEYKKTKTINTNSKKYLKAKKLFEDILISKEEKGTKKNDEVKENDINNDENNEININSLDESQTYKFENKNSEANIMNNLKTKTVKEEENINYLCNSQKSTNNNINANTFEDSKLPRSNEKKKKNGKEKKKKKKKRKRDC